MSGDFQIVGAEPLIRFCQKVFEKMGIPPEDAFITADVLVLADLRGIDSHGVARLRRYYTGLKNGMMVPRPEIKVVRETPITARIDGGGALGQVAAIRGMRMAIEKALKNGAGFVSVGNSNHYGIAGYYSLMALKDDLIGISLTNSDAYVVPTFGKEVMLGTNPISVTAPALQERPFVLDMSTAVATLGKLEVSSRMGKRSPWDGSRMKMAGPATIPCGSSTTSAAKPGEEFCPWAVKGRSSGVTRAMGWTCWWTS